MLLHFRPHYSLPTCMILNLIPIPPSLHPSPNNLSHFHSHSVCVSIYVFQVTRNYLYACHSQLETGSIQCKQLGAANR